MQFSASPIKFLWLWMWERGGQNMSSEWPSKKLYYINRVKSESNNGPPHTPASAWTHHRTPRNASRSSIQGALLSLSFGYK